MEQYLNVMLILVAAVTAVMGYRTGAPLAACVTITPDHGTSMAVGPVPYTVNISSLDDGYTPGETYTIVLSGGSENADFRGFLIQGRMVADGTTTAGAFDDIGDEDQQLTCDNDSGITYTNNDPKTTIELMWTAPPNGTGTIVFRYAFVDDFSVFWSNQTTDTVDEVGNTNEDTNGDAGGATGIMVPTSLMILLLISVITLIN